MSQFSGGIEDYADSMASHYLMEEAPPKAPIGGTDPELMMTTRTDRRGNKSTPIILGRRSTWGKIAPEYENPTELGPYPVPKGPLSYQFTAPTREELLSERSTPNVEKPLSLEKKERIPIDINAPDTLKLMKEAVERSKRPNIVRTGPLINTRTVTGSTKSFTNVTLDPDARQQEATLSDVEAGRAELRRMISEAWSYLRSAPGTPERLGGIQTGVVSLPSGQVTTITSKASSPLKDISIPEPQPESKEPRKLLRRSTYSGRGASEVTTTVMPGYDPHKAKGLFTGSGASRRRVSTQRRLSKLPIEEAIKQGMAIEQEALGSGKGSAPAIKQSLRVGETILGRFGAERQRAEAARALRETQMNEFNQRIAEARSRGQGANPESWPR